MLTRRNFILAAASSVFVTGFLGFTLKSRTVSKSPESLIGGIDTALYSEPIGRIFAADPQCPPMQVLFEKVSGALGADASFNLIPLNKRVRLRVAEDYKLKRAMVVNGWVLPEITVYLSALAIMVKRDVY